MSEITTEQFLEKFDNYRRTKDSVIIHLGDPYDLYEFKKEFIDEVKEQLKKELLLAHTGVDELSPVTKFVISILRDSY